MSTSELRAELPESILEAEAILAESAAEQRRRLALAAAERAEAQVKSLAGQLRRAAAPARVALLRHELTLALGRYRQALADAGLPVGSPKHLAPPPDISTNGNGRRRLPAAG